MEQGTCNEANEAHVLHKLRAVGAKRMRCTSCMLLGPQALVPSGAGGGEGNATDVCVMGMHGCAVPDPTA